jgi:hypothetical protein
MEGIDKTNLIRLSHIALRRYTEGDFDDAWIAKIHKFVSDVWPDADAKEAHLLTTIMAATPYPGWMREFLVPAEQGKIPHSDILLGQFDAIASAGAEGIARENGLTRGA